MPVDAPASGYDFVVVANRLPVDVSLGEDGEPTWTRSPGGLVTALAPVMAGTSGAWVGWGGSPDLELEPFDVDGTELIPVALSEEDLEGFYEGFSNDTLWPLYHDVIASPAFHRPWWEAYQRVNKRFAEAAAEQAAQGATVWVHDYQLQLVPRLLRELRPDLRIGYFHHIPFPPLEIFAQLPWRKQVVEGLLGADLVGFQRAGDAANFVRVVRRFTDLTTRGQMITLHEADGHGEHRGQGRHVRAAAFPISIDSHAFDELARTDAVQARATQIRSELGDPEFLLLGVDRLDYTKGIRHRIKAYGELLSEGRLSPHSTTLVQVASPSRENVGAYQQLRDEVELLVGRINGDYGQVGHAPVQYLHQSFPMEEMAALYLAADVMLVTALRDGMNLVAKEYVAARSDDRGALVLSEFTGAADELTGAVLVNPHDIDGMKDAFTYAVHMEPRESRKRMRRLRRRVLGHDVVAWSEDFLAALNAVPVRASRG
ncbi:trehalose-6-phosphate synthase [uncultured Cellulomonas sp.]|uniref:alpha,alpha-trehalose-phosphate synthase (UDP-forming) n=1 Tax=uncultured Cellulomonas sp. TaxID=189682 RepID=UPI0028EAD375|nr:trehalose-6-phosphate synthase [uncultured Cellulomonas sp.]